MKDTRKIGTIEDRSADPVDWDSPTGKAWQDDHDVRIGDLPDSAGTVNVSVFVHGPCKVAYRPVPGFASIQVGPTVSILLTSADDASNLLEAAIRACNAFALNLNYVEG